jgi:coenzyme F420-reducing hydrogenase alpha subunit
LVEVCDLAVELIESYDPKGPANREAELVEGQGYGISEAPRGILYHHYKTGADGLIQFARITTPTAQNIARMEADLWELAPQVISLPHPEASLVCEHLIRAYDPCFPCATH